MNRLALFDCDGTLVDGQAAICVALEGCLAEAGRAAPPRAAIRRVIGLSVAQAMTVLLPDAGQHEQERVADAYKLAFRALRARGEAEEPLFPGIAAALDALAADGWLLGIATGKSRRGLAHCLAAHGLSDRFVTLQTADRHPSKPAPDMAFAALAEADADPDTSVMIGDTVYDVAMGFAAGMRTVGVAWGYHEADELRAEGADRIAAHASELPALLAGLTAPA